MIAADEVAAEGLAHARTLKMTSVDPTDARKPAESGSGHLVRLSGVVAERASVGSA